MKGRLLMEIWIPAIEGIIILFLMLILVFRKPDKSDAAQRQAVAEMAMEIRREMDAQFYRSRMELSELSGMARQEMQQNFTAFSRHTEEQWNKQREAQDTIWRSADQRIGNFLRDYEQRMQTLQDKVEQRLVELRKTVDEQLNETLHKRVQSSFEAVGRQLLSLQQSLGKVDALRTDVNSLQKVFGNVKTRGTWGEVQLGVLLEQMLAPRQYAKNVHIGKTKNIVEYAIRLPGREEGKEELWLPIDSKFPMEDYLLLMEAQENADLPLIKELTRRIQDRIRECARDIRDKYIIPPYSTEFGILYLPTEGLYAEVLRLPGMIEILQREYRVTVAGPTTLSALLNSLQMGFKTLAVQKYSSEVWQLLGAVKKTMEIHERNLDKAYANLQISVNQLSDARKNAGTIHNRLDKVEDMPIKQLNELLPELQFDDEV
jgi:DNA recombination protein RmuC